jgi:hypothetical protein
MSQHHPGTIASWSALDCVGRIRLSSGEEVRFGASACGFMPRIGLEVVVAVLEPHPLGGKRALRISLARPEQADDELDEAGPLPGMAGAPGDLAAFVELTDAVGLLGVVLRERLTSRASLRAWFRRYGVDVDFLAPSSMMARTPLIRLGDLELRVHVCMGGAPRGEGVISFSSNATVFSLKKERELALAGAELGDGRVSRLGTLRPLVEFVRRCAPDAEGVLTHQAYGSFSTSAEWLAREASGDALAPWCRLVAAKLDSGGEGALWVGCAAWGLPDLFCRASVETSGAWLAHAADALVALGRLPDVDARLGDGVVRSRSADWVELEPPQDRT